MYIKTLTVPKLRHPRLHSRWHRFLIIFTYSIGARETIPYGLLSGPYLLSWLLTISALTNWQYIRVTIVVMQQSGIVTDTIAQITWWLLDNLILLHRSFRHVKFGLTASTLVSAGLEAVRGAMPLVHLKLVRFFFLSAHAIWLGSLVLSHRFFLLFQWCKDE